MCFVAVKLHSELLMFVILRFHHCHKLLLYHTVHCVT